MPPDSLSPSRPLQPDDSTAFQAARRVLRDYPRRFQPLDSKSLAPARPGFSGAQVWRVVTESGPFCLRATPEAAVEPLRLRGLHRLLAHVHACGVVQVALPVARVDGATFASQAGCVWQLEPWMPGIADFRQAPYARKLENAVTCLARWHQAAKSFDATRAEAQWFFVAAGRSPGITERLAQISSWNTEACDLARRRIADDDWSEFRAHATQILELFERVTPRIARELSLGSSLEIALQPCLRDVWHDHVLFTGDNVTALIDAHACRSDCVATDLARLLGSLVPDDHAAWDTGVACYERVRPLNLAERGLIELFDRSAVALSGMTWLNWRYREGRPIDRTDSVLERLAAISRRLEILAET
ncbi:MAG: phosphotransferase enzyme family protein [Planctomycetaceae bacterium]